jgi:hypothetical protein
LPPDADWTTFECDGRSFEYQVVRSRQKIRPAGWPAHKASPGRWEPVLMVIVRRPGDEIGPAMVFPEGTAITTSHAVEVVRLFGEELSRT